MSNDLRDQLDVSLEWERENRVRHRDGIPWHEAPLPRRWHTCTPQTSSVPLGVLRCACGAIASLFGPWDEKNSRRKAERRRS